MKNQKTKIALISIMIFMMSTVMAFAEEVDIVQVNADKYGVLTLIPPIVAIVLAFITKNVVISESCLEDLFLISQESIFFIQ